jgi:hypothetical protein
VSCLIEAGAFDNLINLTIFVCLFNAKSREESEDIRSITWLVIFFCGLD